jgi:hypothetical protein
MRITSLPLLRTLTTLAACFLIASTITIAISGAEGTAPTSIVERAIAYHGGELYEMSTAELDICSKSGCFHVRSKVDGSRFEHEVSGKIRSGELRVRITNETTERWLNGTPEPVETGREQPIRDWAMARVYFCFLPYRLADSSVQHHDLGVVDWNGRSLHKVKLTFAKGSSTDANDEYMYWFDPESARVEQFAYSFEGNPGGLRFRQAKNHRRVGGILFFDQENLGAEGEGLSVDQIDPHFVAQRMRAVSTVELKEIEVESIPRTETGF